MRVLIVEDDPKIASFLIKGLQQHGFAVDHASDGQTGLDLARSGPYDVMVADVMLPRLDGIEMVTRLRSDKQSLPVLLLSARSAVEDRVRGLHAGADDYLTKPFAFSELLARIQALLRRAHPAPAGSPTRLRCGDIEMDLLSRKVTAGGREIELQPREFALLEYLLRHPGRTVTKTMILEHVWDYSFDPQTNVVDVLVHRLRGKIDPNHDRLQTIRGVGYVLRGS